MRRRLTLALASLFALAVLPQAAFADDSTSAAPIVLQAANKPIYYVVPPSTDPEPVHTAVMGTSVVRGTVIHGEGDLLLLDLGGDQAVVRLPDNSALRLPGQSVSEGSLVEAVGTPTAAGVLESLRVTIWMQ
jgi:hypothetical protein